MKIWDYLGVSEDAFRRDYIVSRLIDVATHDTFPLQMFTYGREAVHGNVWDSVTTKCRGIIFNTETSEIVARPFEKFFNLGTAGMPETDPSTWSHSQPDDVLFAEPEVWEKMDGFLATMYEYNGKHYIASKGSFNSTHAKWATAWYQANIGTGPVPSDPAPYWPEGYTPVFEGICSSLRIVVNYEFEGLVLLALVNKETGEELSKASLQTWANRNGVQTPNTYTKAGWEVARQRSLDPNETNVEGYVLTWLRPGQTPFRLKIKYVDYLRLHRMVGGVSAKAIYNCLAGNEYKGDLDEWCNESTPWFSKFVTKWVRGLTARHDELRDKANASIKTVNDKLKFDGALTAVSYAAARKAFALEFNKPEYADVRAILYALLDGKDPEPVIWKQVKPLIKGGGPMLDVSKM